MPAGLIDHFRSLARYNRRANERLYAACALLDDADRKRDRGAFFKSIHGTLNHLIVGDRIWMTRFEGGQAPSTLLDAILYQDFEALGTARQALDRRIEGFAAGLDESAFQRSIAYINNEGRRFDDPLVLLLPHFFNHQTHHRGQVHAMLSQASVATPVLDLHRVLKPDP